MIPPVRRISALRSALGHADPADHPWVDGALVVEGPGFVERPLVRRAAVERRALRATGERDVVRVLIVVPERHGRADRDRRVVWAELAVLHRNRVRRWSDGL